MSPSSCSHYYGVIKKLSSLAGQWPYQPPKVKLLCVSLVTLSVITIMIPQTVKFVKCNVDLQCIFETMTSYMLTSLTLVKLYTCYFNRHRIKALIDRFFTDWDELVTLEEYEILKKYAENGRRYSLGCSLYYFTSTCLFMCTSLIPQLLDVVSPLNESRPILLPYPGYYFVDEREHFLYILCHSIVAWEIAMTGIVAHDCMLLTCVQHICSIFAVARFRFERLIYETATVKILPDPSIGPVGCKGIVFSVRTHQKALKFAQLLEDIFSLSLIMQVTLNTLLISITPLLITHPNSNMSQIMRYIVYIVGLLIHLFYLSFEGQKLIDHNLQMRNNIFNSGWYKLPVKSQKLIVLVLLKCLRPCYMSAGKIYIFSLEGFSTILQASISYFTMLASFQ